MSAQISTSDLDQIAWLTSRRKTYLTVVGSGLVILILYLSTAQSIPNGSPHAYTTDVGEIQNALPRWGTLHFPGYPLYSLTGSLFTTVLRFVGIEPALGTSLYSALWGAISVSLLTALSLAFNVPALAAAATSILFGLATSVWMDASIAEVHTMTVGLLLSSIILALYFGRSGKRSTLLWLSLISTQAVLHQRALIFAFPGLLLLVWPHLRAIRRNLIPALGVAAAGALIYLYLPLRDWMGATWTFNAPGSWEGFWSLLLDTKVDRIVDAPGSTSEIGARITSLLEVLSHDWPIALLVIGLLGLVLGGIWRGWREPGSLLIIALVFPLLTTIIWIGRIGDAALAVNLPTYAMAAVGLAIITAFISKRRQWLGVLMVAIWIGLSVVLFIEGRPEVLEVTRHSGGVEVVETADAFVPRVLSEEPTFMALWGRDYWALAYAKEYQGRLSGFNVVDHNADIASILNEQGKLYTLSSVFYLWSLDYWLDNFGQVFPSLVSPGVIELSRVPETSAIPIGEDLDYDLGNGATIRQAALRRLSPDELLVNVTWEKTDPAAEDHSVAVHLVSKDPPAGPDDIIAQADQSHPVDGWYPLSRWEVGELVYDIYKLSFSNGVDPVAVRIGMYRLGEDGQFQNSRWLSIPLEN